MEYRIAKTERPTKTKHECNIVRNDTTWIDFMMDGVGSRSWLDEGINYGVYFSLKLVCRHNRVIYIKTLKHSCQCSIYHHCGKTSDANVSLIKTSLLNVHDTCVLGFHDISKRVTNSTNTKNSLEQ